MPIIPPYLRLVLWLFVLCQLPSLAVAQQWSCGTDHLSENLTKTMIERDCPKVKGQINNCCKKHDKCYEQQLGQIKCDNEFCKCMQDSTKAEPVCHINEANLFCNSVRTFGAIAYGKAAKPHGRK